MENQLFPDTNIRVMSDDILREFKKDFKPDIDYHKAMFDKYEPIYRDNPIDVERIFSAESIDYLKEVSHYILYKTKLIRESYIYPETNYADLKSMLDVDIVYEGEIGDNSNTRGLSFVDAYTKVHRLDCKIQGKGDSCALNVLRDDKGLYIAVLKAMYFHKNRLTPKTVLKVVELIVPVVSNIRIIYNVLCWDKYGVQKAKERGQNYVSLLCSSEGWLGRLLSSYKVAYDNPDLQIYYTSNDPNVLVNRAAKLMIKDLNNYLKLDNWHPETHLIGSENFKSKRIHEGIEVDYDMQITSSPYFNLEVYHETFVVTLSDGEVMHLSEIESLTIQGANKYEEPISVKAKNLEVGNTLIDFNATIQSIKPIGQSHQFRTPEEWRVNFQLATYKNVYNLLVDGGYNLINIANVKSCMFLEDYTEQSFSEAGFEKESMSWYKLSRKPSKNPDSAITVRKGEPLFIYKKPLKG